MTTEKNSPVQRQMTFDDIRLRKQEVLQKIRQEQKRIRYLTDQLVDDYHRPLWNGLLSVPNVKRVGSIAGGTFYAFRLLRSISRVTGVFRRR